MSHSHLQSFGQTGKEGHAHLHLIKDFCFLLLFLCQFLMKEIVAYHPGDKNYQSRDVQQFCPDGKIPRWQHRDVLRIDFSTYLSFTIYDTNREMIVAIRQTIVDNINISRLQIIPVMITALQLVCIDSRRMISKRKVCKLQAKTVLIALEHQFLTTLIPWFAIHDNARQNQPVEFI